MTRSVTREVSSSAIAGARTIGIRVPYQAVAADHFSSIVGSAAVQQDTRLPRRGYYGGVTTIQADPTVRIELLDVEHSHETLPPRVVDIGTHHLCWRVTDIDSAATYIDALPGTTLLGDIIEVPDGPIAGNRWIYYETVWGTLFELQQWPETPAYTPSTGTRLDHTVHNVPGSLMPGYAGVDHSGYSVNDLEATIQYLTDQHDGHVALRTEIEAGRDFMKAQFGIDVEGTSQMAMLNVHGLNIELFEHHVEGKRPARHSTAFGGHHLLLDNGGHDVAAQIVGSAVEDDDR